MVRPNSIRNVPLPRDSVPSPELPKRMSQPLPPKFLPDSAAPQALSTSVRSD